jgi:uncharacterized membrane protein
VEIPIRDHLQLTGLPHGGLVETNGSPDLMPAAFFPSTLALHFPGEDEILVWIDAASVAIETLAVGIIVVTILFATARYAYQAAFQRVSEADYYRDYKALLGKSLLLGLEILVAADIVRTVALEATLSSVAVLGILVLIRTFLSWSLVVELDGRWPWQPRQSEGKVMGKDQ